MAEFESGHSYVDFSWSVMRKSRYILEASSQRFLDAVVETSAKRKAFIQKGGALWRAQLGNGWRTEKSLDDNGHEIDAFEVEHPLPPERMVPLPSRAYEGRVNPKGIPCLYFSTDMETGMTETRPWIGSYVSVAQFVMLRNLTVVDCSAESGPAVIVWLGTSKEPPPGKREEMVWRDINRAFSQPVTRNDDVAECAPTQVLAEAFCNAGYDGIVYGSKLGSGKTVAVFDLAAAELANCHLYRLEAISPKFSMAANPYYTEKYCDTEQPKGSGDPVETTEDQG